MFLFLKLLHYRFVHCLTRKNSLSSHFLLWKGVLLRSNVGKTATEIGNTEQRKHNRRNWFFATLYFRHNPTEEPDGKKKGKNSLFGQTTYMAPMRKKITEALKMFNNSFQSFMEKVFEVTRRGMKNHARTFPNIRLLRLSI